MLRLVVCFLVTNSFCVNGAPRNRTKPEFYDQRQTGDYNIRLNLKDFQIIALVAGDTDYEYDYELPSDYTDVPMPTTSNSSVSNLPSTTLPTISIKPKPSTTTTKTHTTKKSQSTTRRISTTSGISSTTILPLSSSTVTTPSTTLAPNVVSTTVNAEVNDLGNANRSKLINTVQRFESVVGDKIPVFVVPQLEGSLKAATPSSSVAIVTEESAEDEEERPVALGEIHAKRCPQGYTRDKIGRCRKLRRPPLFDFSRLTSNLASKFRRPNEEIVSKRS